MDDAQNRQLSEDCNGKWDHIEYAFDVSIFSLPLPPNVNTSFCSHQTICVQKTNDQFSSCRKHERLDSESAYKKFFELKNDTK